jgi:hypothetical protein
MKRIYIVTLVNGSAIAVYSGLHENIHIAQMAAQLQFPNHEVFSCCGLDDQFVLDAASELMKATT